MCSVIPAAKQKCVATHLQMHIYGPLHTVYEWITVRRLMSAFVFLFFETFMHHRINTSARRTQSCTQRGYSLYLPACPSPLDHSVMQCMGREGERAGTVTVAPVAHGEVYTPLPCLVSITPPLALGQSARWHLCAAHASQWHSIHPLSCWHQDSLPLPVDMSASSPPLYLSLWMGFFLILIWKEWKVALALLSSTCRCIMSNWLFESAYYLTVEYTNYLPYPVSSGLIISATPT